MWHTADLHGDGALDWPIHFCHPDANGREHSYMFSGHDGSLQEWPFDLVPA